MATKPFPINATVTATTFAVFDPDRRSLYIRNYSASTQTMWVAFGVAATAGANGEMEIQPGYEYSFGGSLQPTTKTLPFGMRLPNCPLEYVSIITSTGTATGCIVTQ